MGFFKPNLWKILFAFLLFSAASITLLILRFVHTCPLPASGFISLTTIPTPDPKFSPDGGHLIKDTVAILKASCDINEHYTVAAKILAYSFLGVCAYILSCIILFFPHRNK